MGTMMMVGRARRPMGTVMMVGQTRGAADINTGRMGRQTGV